MYILPPGSLDQHSSKRRSAVYHGRHMSNHELLEAMREALLSRGKSRDTGTCRMHYIAHVDRDAAKME